MSESSNNQNTNQNQDYNWELEQQVNTENMNEDELRRRKQALENGDDPMNDNLSNHEENDMETDKDGRTWITVSRAIRRYKASINIKHINGNNWKQKMDTVQKQIGDIDEFIGIRLINVGKEQYITAEFGNKETMLAACNRQIELNSDYKLQPTLNYGDDDVKDRTLIVKDLPLNLNRYTLRQILEKRTSTNVVDLKAKVMGPYMKATVLFEKRCS